jgi:hypothetical protein
MLTWRVPANFIFGFHEVKYEVPEYVTNFEGSSQRSSEGLRMIRAQEKHVVSLMFILLLSFYSFLVKMKNCPRLSFTLSIFYVYETYNSFISM